MKRELRETVIGNYYDLFLNYESILNKKDYSQNKRFDQENILKLTFENTELKSFNNLFNALSHTNGLKIGYYNRYSGERVSWMSRFPNSSISIKGNQYVSLYAVYPLSFEKSLPSIDTRYSLSDLS